MGKNKTKRRRISVRSIEEKMSDKLMQIYDCSPKQAWDMLRLKSMERELKSMSNL